MNLDIIDVNGKNLGKVDADPSIFGVKRNDDAVNMTMKWLLASRRQGTHSTLTRHEVSGGGKKPWKQKGTGRARAGSIRSPLWRHGAVIFGPKPRDYSFHLPKKIRMLASKVVLSERAKDGNVVILDSLDVPNAKTKLIQEIVNKIGAKGKETLIIMSDVPKNVRLASRNIEGLEVKRAREVNIHELMKARTIVIVKDAVDKLKEMLL